MQNYIRTTIERAIAQGRRVRIIYQSGDDLSERTIKPKYIGRFNTYKTIQGTSSD